MNGNNTRAPYLKIPELPKVGEYGEGPFSGLPVWIIIDGWMCERAVYCVEYADIPRVFLLEDETLIAAEEVSYHRLSKWKQIWRDV